MLTEGGFTLRKWMSNSKDVMETVPEDLGAQKPLVTISEQDSLPTPTVKTLGVSWSATADEFSFTFPTPTNVTYTRRGILSQMCRLFDPRGQLSPFTVRARVMFQESCLSGAEWDAPLEEHQRAKWQAWFGEMSDLSSFKVPRCFKGDNATSQPTLHTFVDASASTYAAATYIRHTNQDGSARLSLVMAKARTAPVRRSSIPVLELQGAVLGARVADEVKTALGISSADCYYWTDSMNVIHWVRSPSRKFRVEVCNRISEVQDCSASNRWQHISGKINPADKPTRGLSASQLQSDTNWWHGPDFLKCPKEDWPHKDFVVPTELRGQTKKGLNCTFEASQRGKRLHPHDFSSWSQLARVTAWTQRFIQSCRRSITREAPGKRAGIVRIPFKSGTVDIPELTAEEVQNAKGVWIRQAQQESYEPVITVLQGKSHPAGTHLQQLQPCLKLMDGTELLVVGRQSTAYHLPSGIREPIILPNGHRVTNLIIAEEDSKCKHTAGTNHLLAILAETYWIVKGKAMVKKHQYGCVGCGKVYAKAAQPQIAPLRHHRALALVKGNLASSFRGLPLPQSP